MEGQVLLKFTSCVAVCVVLSLCYQAQVLWQEIFQECHTVYANTVSCPSANKFSAILCLLLVRSSSNSPRSLEGFRQTLVPNFI